jgi:hypothetical protein
MTKHPIHWLGELNSTVSECILPCKHGGHSPGQAPGFPFAQRRPCGAAQPEFSSPERSRYPGAAGLNEAGFLSPVQVLLTAPFAAVKATFEEQFARGQTQGDRRAPA